mmetsp:Transcript_123049/g.244932  ORF Transcript_123049/g.244932 Transcript_123049/m.244932 type:complete len:83 (+) Transcript_123049:111-359(+)
MMQPSQPSDLMQGYERFRPVLTAAAAPEAMQRPRQNVRARWQQAALPLRQCAWLTAMHQLSVPSVATGNGGGGRLRQAQRQQ